MGTPYESSARPQRERTRVAAWRARRGLRRHHARRARQYETRAGLLRPTKAEASTIALRIHDAATNTNNNRKHLCVALRCVRTCAPRARAAREGTGAGAIGWIHRARPWRGGTRLTAARAWRQWARAQQSALNLRAGRGGATRGLRALPRNYGRPRLTMSIRALGVGFGAGGWNYDGDWRGDEDGGGACPLQRPRRWRLPCRPRDDREGHGLPRSPGLANGSKKKTTTPNAHADNPSQYGDSRLPR